MSIFGVSSCLCKCGTELLDLIHKEVNNQSGILWVEVTCPNCKKNNKYTLSTYVDTNRWYLSLLIQCFPS